jgi:myo-inositol 2-dehydrogenase/D-chiro-inositol 1-dehydrogenase
MRFALFGSDPAALAMARAIAAFQGHELTRVVRPPEGAPSGSAFGANVRFCKTWEDLLSDAEVDAVIVTGAGDEQQQAVRQLVLAGKSVLLPAELTQPAAFFYELALIEAECPGSLFPLLGLRGHPLVLRLRELVLQEGLGRLHHARLERKLAPVAQSLPGEDELAQALLIDADLLRYLCGEYDQVTASRSGDAARGYSLATVTLDGPSLPPAIWTVSAATGEFEWRLTLTGNCGTAILEGEPECGAFRLTINVDGQATSEECVDAAGSWLIKQFIAFLARGAERPRTVAIECEPKSFWDELARSVELVDAVERSVRRRRTIDVHFEAPSERGLFKTQMTAIGCCLLVLTPAAIVVYLAIAAAVELPDFVKRILVGLLFLPLGVFLLLQLMLFVSRPAPGDRR